jgi:ribose 5-phosphate isomerase B
VDRLTIAFGADDTNECVSAVRAYLESVADVKALTPSDRWPEIAQEVGRCVANGDARFGVLLCWTGTGTAIAANKVPGVRAIQAWEPWIATGARKWNDANVLALSLKRTAPDVAVECVKAFLDVERPDEDELANIEMLRGL